MLDSTHATYYPVLTIGLTRTDQCHLTQPMKEAKTLEDQINLDMIETFKIHHRCEDTPNPWYSCKI